MKLTFLIFTFTLLVIACGKRNNYSGRNYPHCMRRDFEITNCRRMYASTYGEPYTTEMCNRFGQHVACN